MFTKNKILLFFIILVLTSCLGVLENNQDPIIYLVGDSTVKTYTEEEYIAGWGQFLSYFVKDNIQVINAAQGGRSSRSFINEGRLYPVDGNKITFGENNRKSIEETIKSGDFLFIQFGHNDDDSAKDRSYSTMVDRMVPVGEANNGIYPVTEGVRTSTSSLPQEYVERATQEEQSTFLQSIARYGNLYYAYDSKGTYKWFLKQYIVLARNKGAIPVLVTPVSRNRLKNGKVYSGSGHFGENFAYIEAVRQLAKEEDCLLIDLFDKTARFLETVTQQYATFLMALTGTGSLKGEWPSGYDNAYGNQNLGITGSDGTHYNKFGAFITAGFVAETILAKKDNRQNNGEYFSFADYVLNTPKSYIEAPTKIPSDLVNKILSLFSILKIKA